MMKAAIAVMKIMIMVMNMDMDMEAIQMTMMNQNPKRKLVVKKEAKQQKKEVLGVLVQIIKIASNNDN